MPRVKKLNQLPQNADDERLNRLLDVAAEIFLREGYEATSVGEIAARAKASKQTFYSRFTTKEELFIAVIRRRCDEIFRDVSALVLSGGSVPEVLRRALNVLLAKILSPEGIALYRIVHMESGRLPILGKMFYEMGPQRGRDFLAGYFEEQMGKRNLRKAHPVVAAEQLQNLAIGHLAMRTALGIEVAPSRKRIAQVVDAAVDTFMRAYGAPR